MKKLLFIPALAFIALTIGSCSKKENLGIPVKSGKTDKQQQVNRNVAQALKAIAEARSGSAGRDFSNPARNYTTYSTPNANVYKWSDPTTGAEFKLSEATGGGGLGQLAYNGKSFDYNYVLSIKASANDPNWDGFMNGRDLRGCVAIDGELTDSDFILNNLAIFLVATTGGSGKYKFIEWDSSTLGTADGIGELLDFSSLVVPNLANMDNAKFYVTNGGHVNVSDSEFSMASDAKVEDVDTGVKYTIEGSIMLE